jgi:hypothetical protein
MADRDDGRPELPVRRTADRAAHGSTIHQRIIVEQRLSVHIFDRNRRLRDPRARQPRQATERNCLEMLVRQQRVLPACPRLYRIGSGSAG